MRCPKTSSNECTIDSLGKPIKNPLMASCLKLRLPHDPLVQREKKHHKEETSILTCFTATCQSHSVQHHMYILEYNFNSVLHTFVKAILLQPACNANMLTFMLPSAQPRHYCSSNLWSNKPGFCSCLPQR